MTLFEAGRDIPATTSEQQEVEDDQFNEQTPTPTAAADSDRGLAHSSELI